jgi:hypothetical protein
MTHVLINVINLFKPRNGERQQDKVDSKLFYFEIFWVILDQINFKLSFNPQTLFTTNSFISLN